MNAHSPRYSVLLPTHNRADVLGFAIESVLAQTEPDFELLIVADGCTDGTRDVVASLSDPRIHFFDLPKAPHFGYANRNVALREARGRLIAFAAHDDLLLPDHLALMGKLLDQNKASWGYSRPLWVSTDGIIVPFCTNLGNADELNYFLTRSNTIPAPCVVHTRAVLEQVGFWPEDANAAGDWLLWRRMLNIARHSGAYLSHPTCLHFSAKWKQSRFSASDVVQVLLNIADNDPCWPSIMRHTPSGGEPEQAALWRAIKAGGDPWISALRMATNAVIDRIAWNAIWGLVARPEAARDTQASAQMRPTS
jgi:glycosyltransferase involved in cell wall biosynthesis